MDSATRVRRGLVVGAAAGGLGYAASKVHFALTDRLGLPGFPAATSSYRGAGDVTLAQLGNAGVGLVAAGLAIGLWAAIRSRSRRLAVHGASWVALILVTAGLVGFALRLLGLRGSAEPTPESPAAQLLLLAGAIWILTWAAALVLHWPASVRAHERAGTASSSSSA